ncbi:gamma-glutamyltransferase family protein [Salicibibacter halophilus]|nr:gamma-glutamyltransferase [Salicibibacter halophilus]
MMIILSIIAVLVSGLVILAVQDGDHEEEENGSPEATEDAVGDIEESETITDEYGVSASHSLAQEAGEEVLEEGGNAVDAAIATSLTLTVVEPYGSGIGGGGAMLVMDDADETPDFYDYRETAPMNTSSDNPADHYAGVPGFLKGLQAVHDEDGSMEMSRLMEPAIHYAENGFEVNWMLEERIDRAEERMDDNAEDVFYMGGDPIEEGNPIVQPELADTLSHLQEEGLEDFYSGELASEIAGDKVSWSEEDLESYEVLTENPASGAFGDYQVYSAPPPSSGVTLIQMLQMADQLDITEHAPHSPEFVGTFTEIWEEARSDRYLNIGDPSFNDIETSELTSLEHTDSMLDEINTSIALDVSDDVKSSTTQINVVDEDGMMVSATNSLSNFFGSGVMNDAGILLNNQMSNFAFNEESNPNYYEEEKRARTYISPTILAGDDDAVLIGSPGGARIPQVLGQVLVNAEREDMDHHEAFDLPRFAHHQNVEEDVEEIRLEDGDSGWDEANASEIESLDYDVDPEFYTNVFFGSIEQLVVDLESGEVERTEDPRR